MTRAEAKAIRRLVKQGELAALLGGLTEKIEKSDREGYTLKTIYLGDIPVKKDYTEVKLGTADNPINWVPAMAVIGKLYYKYKGKTYKAIKSGVPLRMSDEYFEEVIT